MNPTNSIMTGTPIRSVADCASASISATCRARMESARAPSELRIRAPCSPDRFMLPATSTSSSIPQRVPSRRNSCHGDRRDNRAFTRLERNVPNAQPSPASAAAVSAVSIPAPPAKSTFTKSKYAEKACTKLRRRTRALVRNILEGVTKPTAPPMTKTAATAAPLPNTEPASAAPSTPTTTPSS